MLYLYDNAISEDLRKSFNPDAVSDPLVRVVDPEAAVELAAQIQNDEVKYPIVALTRTPGVSVDKNRMNFTRAHRGVQAVLDPITNNLYYERAIPIQLSYKLTIITTNTADMDEIEREILFKYLSMYFLTFTLPYECKRKIRFGVTIDPDTEIESKSGTYNYLSNGQLYETIIPLRCEGCVLVTYTPAKLTRSQVGVEAVTKIDI